MNLIKALFSTLIVLAAAAPVTHAQGWQKGLSAASRGAAAVKTTRAGIAAAKAAARAEQIISRTVSQKTWLGLGTPTLRNLENNLSRFTFSITPRGMKNGPKANGFVFAERYKGKTILWGASSAQTVRGLGKDVTVTFHVDGQPVSFPATVEVAGHEQGLNAALIKLPEEAYQVALPFTLSPTAVSPKETLFTFGFNKNGFKKTVRSALVPGSERILTDVPLFSAPQPEMGGSVVLNEKGFAVGIDVGLGYEVKTAPWADQIGQKEYKPLTKALRVGEVVPARQLNTLLREYHTAEAGSRVVVLSGMKIGKIGVGEYIDQISVTYKDGSVKNLERSPLWDLQFMDVVIPQITQAQQVEFLIKTGDGTQFIYQADLLNRKAVRQDL